MVRVPSANAVPRGGVLAGRENPARGAAGGAAAAHEPTGRPRHVAGVAAAIAGGPPIRGMTVACGCGPMRAMPATTGGTRRVLVVEDHRIMRERLERIVAAHPALELAAAVGTCAEARAALAEQRIDVALVDLGLPDGDGVGLIRDIRRVPAAPEVLVISVFGDEEHVVTALEAGATGYLLKDASPHDVGAAIVDLLAGGSPISPAIARHLLQRFRGARAPAGERPPMLPPDLTARELEVLEVLAKGFTYEEAAGILGITFNTVASHVKHIYGKLAVGTRGEAVYEATQLGILKLR
jgi:DNA-binding NarL/FixJ family response regulator